MTFEYHRMQDEFSKLQSRISFLAGAIEDKNKLLQSFSGDNKKLQKQVANLQCSLEEKSALLDSYESHGKELQNTVYLL